MEESSHNARSKGGMFQGASRLIFVMAKELRNNMTEAEKILWMHLKKGVGGMRFRRQHPIDIYVVDFFCHRAKLIVEVDGSIHNDPEQKEADEVRQSVIENMGYRVIRFTNEEVMLGVEKVIDRITNEISQIENIQKQIASPKSGV